MSFVTLPGNILQDQMLTKSHRLRKKNGERKKCNAFLSGARMHFAKQIHCQGLDKEMLEPMRPLVTALQGMLVEVYFGFQKIEEIINCYADLDACTRKVLVYQNW